MSSTSTASAPAAALALAQRVARSRFVRDFGKLTGATIGSQLIALAVAPILTRLYAPATFGVYQLYVSIVSVGLVVVSLRYEIAIPVAANETRAAQLAVLALRVAVTFGLSVSATGCVWLLLHKNASMYGAVDGVAVICLGFSLMFGGIANILSYLAIRRREFGVVGVARITQSSTMMTASVAGGAMLPLSGVLLASDAIGRLSGALWVLRKYWSNLKNVNCSRLKLWAVGRRYRDYPLVSVPSGIVNVAGLSVTPVLLFSLFGAVPVAFFGLVDRVFAAPGVLVSTAVSQLYAGEFARLRSDGPAALRRTMLRLMMMQAAVGIIPFSAIAILGHRLFPVVFGSQWQEAGVYAALLVPGYFAGFLVGPLHLTLLMLERQRWQLGWDCGRLAGVALGWGLNSYLGGSIRTGLVVYTLVQTCSYIAYAVLSLKAVSRDGQRPPAVPGAVALDVMEP